MCPIYEVCRTVTALSLLVVTSCNSSVNPVTVVTPSRNNIYIHISVCVCVCVSVYKLRWKEISFIPFVLEARKLR
jgi:hypothetical protein